jgi:hypothetical protein
MGVSYIVVFLISNVKRRFRYFSSFLTSPKTEPSP